MYPVSPAFQGRGDAAIELFVQFLVLAATAALFWFARRDLAARAAPPPAAADTRELEQLCVALETLVTDLSYRLDAVERRLASSGPSSKGAGMPPRPSTMDTGESNTPSVLASAPMEPPDVPDLRYAPVYALLQAGESDPQEIARRTGLARGEVDLILSLRARRAL